MEVNTDFRRSWEKQISLYADGRQRGRRTGQRWRRNRPDTRTTSIRSHGGNKSVLFEARKRIFKLSGPEKKKRKSVCMWLLLVKTNTYSLTYFTLIGPTWGPRPAPYARGHSVVTQTINHHMYFPYTRQVTSKYCIYMYNPVLCGILY